MSIQDFERPSLTDVAYQEIRNSILLGETMPGDKLVVNDLVDKWKISNTPIKEALNRLVAEGLVEAVPRRGMRVRVLTAKELREIVEIRTLYEVHFCHTAVERIGENQHLLEEMRSTLEKCRAVLAEGYNYLIYYQLDEMFHMLIASLCGNDMLIRSFDRIHAHFITLGIHADRDLPLRRLRDSHEEHYAIFQGLERRDLEAMESAMRTHLGNAVENLLKLYSPKSGRYVRK